MGDGFDNNTFTYLKDLTQNNSRNWFEANRNRYEDEWLKPATNFVTALALKMDTLNPRHIAIPKINKSIRRINRDTRFSKDKTPYNPRMHLIFWTGDHPNRSPAIHFVLSANSVGFGVGEWMWTPEKIGKFRATVQDKPQRDALLSAIKSAQTTGCELEEPQLKRLPAGVPQGSGYDHLLKRKGLVVRTISKPLSTHEFLGQTGIDRAIDIAEKLSPVNRWLLQL